MIENRGNRDAGQGQGQKAVPSDTLTVSAPRLFLLPSMTCLSCCSTKAAHCTPLLHGTRPRLSHRRWRDATLSTACDHLTVKIFGKILVSPLSLLLSPSSPPPSLSSTLAAQLPPPSALSPPHAPPLSPWLARRAA